MVESLGVHMADVRDFSALTGLFFPVCVCVCVCVCMCVYVCMCAFVYVCLCVSVHAFEKILLS